jgi:hypothetical protein
MRLSYISDPRVASGLSRINRFAGFVATVLVTASAVLLASFVAIAIGLN